MVKIPSALHDQIFESMQEELRLTTLALQRKIAGKQESEALDDELSAQQLRRPKMTSSVRDSTQSSAGVYSATRTHTSATVTSTGVAQGTPASVLPPPAGGRHDVMLPLASLEDANLGGSVSSLAATDPWASTVSSTADKSALSGTQSHSSNHNDVAARAAFPSVDQVPVPSSPMQRRRPSPPQPRSDSPAAPSDRASKVIENRSLASTAIGVEAHDGSSAPPHQRAQMRDAESQVEKEVEELKYDKEVDNALSPAIPPPSTAGDSLVQTIVLVDSDVQTDSNVQPVYAIEESLSDEEDADLDDPILSAIDPARSLHHLPGPGLEPFSLESSAAVSQTVAPVCPSDGPLERSLALLLPAVVEGGVDAVIQAIERAGMRVVVDKYVSLTSKEARQLLWEHSDIPAFDRALLSMIERPCRALVISGPSAISTWRQLLAFETARRGQSQASAHLPLLFHGSASRIHAEREIAFFFDPHDPGINTDITPTTSLADGALPPPPAKAGQPLLVR